MLFCSYIKPQLRNAIAAQHWVVCYFVPTSNHNMSYSCCSVATVVCYFVPTSNHNQIDKDTARYNVVCYFVPTSNHNIQLDLTLALVLYVILFLHQTTTYAQSNSGI